MWIIALALVFVAVGGTVTALTTDPERQAVTLSLYGLLLTLLFFVLSAPDVALAQLAAGTVVVPLIVMLAVRKIRHVREGAEDAARAERERDEAARAEREVGEREVPR